MTYSARLPVYALLIGAFIPRRSVWGVLDQQGLVLFGLYVAGIGGALVVAWYVFAPQCLSTLATIKRETGGWTMPLIAAGYLFGLAYLASFVTYRGALAMGDG